MQNYFNNRMTLKFLINILGLLFLFSSISISLYSENRKHCKTRVIENFILHHSAYPKQKVYLHLDKSKYQAEETIWFKVYLLDGKTHLPVKDSTNVYVELINSNGNLMAMRLLLAKDGFAHGDIKLDYDIPDGNYILRAYSSIMTNYAEDYYYTHYLYISNPNHENNVSRLDVLNNLRFNRTLNRMSKNLVVEFFPEGGRIIPEVSNRIGFNIADELGLGKDAEVRVVNQHGVLFAQFSTEVAGYGAFEFVPRVGDVYKAEVSFNGQKSTFALPDVSKTGNALRIEQSTQKLYIKLVNQGYDKKGNPADSIIIIGHTRGQVYFAESFLMSDNYLEIEVDKKLFPSGIAHFAALSCDNLLISERLIFIEKNDIISINSNISIVEDEQNNFIKFQINVLDVDGNPVKGNFSLSAVAQNSKPSSSINIRNYMIYGSDIKDVKADPIGIFEQARKKGFIIDNLLLQHNWERFEWEDIFLGKMPDKSHTYEAGVSLSGRLLDPAKKEPVGFFPVRLKVKSGYNDTYETKTNRQGFFVFNNLYYHGELDIELSSRRIQNNYPPIFELNFHKEKGYNYQPGVHTRPQHPSGLMDLLRSKGSKKKTRSTTEQRNSTPQLYGVPDQTIYIDYELFNERNLLDILKIRGTGLSIYGNQIIIRGPTSIYGDNEARYMVDGVFVAPDFLLGLSPRDVERIEIFKGTSTAVFGIKGGTGVIVAYSRLPGYEGLQDVLSITISGFHKPRDFYDDYSLMHRTVHKATSESIVFWEPNIITDSNGKAELLLPFRMNTDKLHFVIQGVDSTGSFGYSTLTVDILD